MTVETVIIHPEPPENQKAMAKELLELADNFRDVEYVMWPEPGFRVPEDLFAKFLKARTSTSGSEPEPEADEPKVESEPVKRKPGRPKKEGQ